MTDNRQGGYGAVLKIDVSGLTVVTHVMDFEFAEFEKILAEITAHDSPGGYAEFISTGKRKMNAFTVKLVWDIAETSHAAMQAAFDSDNAVNMSTEDPNSYEVIAFAAQVSKIGRIAEQEEGYVCDVEIQPTGIPTINGSEVMNILNREAILAANDIAIEKISVPEWGGDIFVKTITAAERGFIEARMIEMGKDGQTKNVKVDNLTTYIAFLSICDEDGKRLFIDIKDVERLGKKSSSALDRVAEAAQKLARMSPADINKMVDELKNSRAAALPSD